MRSSPILALVGLLAALGTTGCRATAPFRPPGTIRYVGSSTVAVFLRDAEPVYGAVVFRLDTKPESDGGERAIVEGRATLAGIARRPQTETLRTGVVSTLIGRDAIAVIVNAKNPVTNLSTDDLRRLFTGGVTNWREVGGPDLPVKALVVGEESATRQVFQNAVLGESDYAAVEEVRPDRAIIDMVRSDPGAVGQITFSFLNGASGVRAVSVDGERPNVTNFDYPIARPLHLLWREGDPVVESFVRWALTPEGQRVVMQHFVGARVVGSVRGAEATAETGTLVVYTQTYPVYDGGIYYYPHRPYEILDRHGNLLRRVANHRGENDEAPMRIGLAPDTYLIRTKTSRGEEPEFFVTIESGRVVELDVLELLGEHR